VRLFGPAAEAVGSRELDLEVPEGTTAAAIRARLASRGGPVLERCAVAVDGRPAEPGAAVPPGSEVALLPPVSGGQGGGLLRTGPEPISVDLVLQAVADPDLGGRVLFLGTVRGRTDGTETSSLEYDAYREMAARVLEDIASRAEELWPGVRIAIWHRTGTLHPGDTAVAVAAAAAHRGDAFAAARLAIECVKAELPVWKKERAPDGTGRWAWHP
jgi:molybdopterin synthase catalytic subunit